VISLAETLAQSAAEMGLVPSTLHGSERSVGSGRFSWLEISYLAKNTRSKRPYEVSEQTFESGQDVPKVLGL
jgi:hypothetical protein